MYVYCIVYARLFVLTRDSPALYLVSLQAYARATYIYFISHILNDGRYGKVDDYVHIYLIFTYISVCVCVCVFV